jgi:hypothetical protein
MIGCFGLYKGNDGIGLKTLNKALRRFYGRICTGKSVLNFIKVL